jgi:tRNA G18 (ribose-2'-O)-methylase SpoU
LRSELTLIGHDIEGEWNLPLLENAAAISQASLLLAPGDPASRGTAGPSGSSPEIEELLGRFDHVVACEAIPASRNVYDYTAPRGQLGVIVGNERSGIPRDLLQRAGQVVSIPMFGRGMTSVNVAVAAAIILYALQRDLGRKRLRASALSHRDVDLLVLGSPNPHELGSLFRSAWAFGWRRVFLADPEEAWFSEDRATILAGRAAARRELNRLAILPADRLELREYAGIVVCDGERQGTPLSRFSLPPGPRLLLVYGSGVPPFDGANPAERVFIDYAAAEVTACYRHAGSILLSVISQLLRGKPRG